MFSPVRLPAFATRRRRAAEAASDQVLTLLESSVPLLRLRGAEEAVRVNECPSSAAVEALSKVAEHDTDFAVRGQATRSLGVLGRNAESAVPALCRKALNQQLDLHERLGAVRALGSIGSLDAASPLADVLWPQADSRLAAEAAKSLLHCRPGEECFDRIALAAMIGRAQHDALRVLVRHFPRRECTRSTVVELLTNPASASDTRCGIEQLGELGRPPEYNDVAWSTHFLCSRMNDRDDEVRRVAVVAISKIAPQLAVRELIARAVCDRTPAIQVVAVEALGKLLEKSNRALPPGEDLSLRRRANIRRAIRRASGSGPLVRAAARRALTGRRGLRSLWNLVTAG